MNTVIAILLVGSATELWVGHQVVRGSREVPVLGSLETKSESFLLARVTRQEDAILIDQRACRVDLGETLGVRVSMAPSVVARLPKTRIRFDRDRSRDTLRATSWQSGWGVEDVDGDGKPGVTINVNSALCSGALSVASATTSNAEARFVGDRLVGKMRVRVEQRVLDASTTCLQLATGDSVEEQQGQVIYEPAPRGTTCESLARGPWPVRVMAAALEAR